MPEFAPLYAAISCLFGPTSSESDRDPEFMPPEEKGERDPACEKGDRLSVEPAAVCISCARCKVSGESGTLGIFWSGGATPAGNGWISCSRLSCGCEAGCGLQEEELGSDWQAAALCRSCAVICRCWILSSS